MLNFYFKDLKLLRNTNEHVLLFHIFVGDNGQRFNKHIYMTADASQKCVLEMVNDFESFSSLCGYVSNQLCRPVQDVVTSPRTCDSA